jgi:hypothetical protein
LILQNGKRKNPPEKSSGFILFFRQYLSPTLDATDDDDVLQIYFS